MEELLICITFILSIIAIVVSSNNSSRLSVRVNQLEKEITKLHEQLKKMRIERRTEAEKSYTPPIDFAPSKESTPETIPIHQESEGKETESTEEKETETVSETPNNVIPSQVLPPKPPKKRNSREIEALIGGKLLNRIGAIAMIFAVGFFLKFAFDNNWINEWTRVGMGAVFGVGMIVLAGYFHKKEGQFE